MLWPFRTRKRTASNPGRELVQIRLDSERDLRRLVCNQLRADMYAKGRLDMTPIDWDSL